MVILDLCKLPELLIVAACAVNLNLMSPNQPECSEDRTFIGSILNTCDCQMDKFLNLTLQYTLAVLILERSVNSTQWISLIF